MSYRLPFHDDCKVCSAFSLQNYLFFSALNKMNAPSYLPKPVQLKVGITISYHSNAIDFTACCSTHKYSYVLNNYDQLPRLGKRELLCLVSFTNNYVLSVRRGFLFLLVFGKDCDF